MKTDPGIMCFQHCNAKVFYINLPEQCPLCELKLDKLKTSLLPFRLPYPFVKAFQHPCSIVLRPTNGDFLNDYNNSKQLHIAVTTSRGNIVEFNENGLQMHIGEDSKKVWLQSLVVENISDPWYDSWDSILMEMCKQPEWTKTNYNAETFNCYTLVLKFLQLLNCGELSQLAQSKTDFCEKFIVPKTTAAGKYISLYRRIREKGFHIRLPSDESNNCDNKSFVNTKHTPVDTLCTITE